MSTSIFEEYEEEYKSIVNNINNIITEIKSSSNNNKTKSNDQLKNCKDFIKQLDEIIKQLDMEARSQSGETKKILSDKVGQFKINIKQLNSDIEKLNDKINRSNLIGNKSEEQRDRLIDVSQKLDDQNDIISSTLRIVEETEQVGVKITEELSSNRDKIETSRNHATQLKSDMNVAEKTLKEMKNRDKCIIS